MKWPPELYFPAIIVTGNYDNDPVDTGPRILGVNTLTPGVDSERIRLAWQSTFEKPENGFRDVEARIVQLAVVEE